MTDAAQTRTRHAPTHAAARVRAFTTLVTLAAHTDTDSLTALTHTQTHTLHTLHTLDTNTQEREREAGRSSEK